MLLGPSCTVDFASCPARQVVPASPVSRSRPCARTAATRGSESPNEEVLERLRRAEAEAAQLRKEIAAAKVRALRLSVTVHVCACKETCTEE